MVNDGIPIVELDRSRVGCAHHAPEEGSLVELVDFHGTPAVRFGCLYFSVKLDRKKIGQKVRIHYLEVAGTPTASDHGSATPAEGEA